MDYAFDGVRLLNAGDHEGAIAACTKAIESDPSSVGARRTRSEAYRRSGRRNEAAADRRYVRTRPVKPQEIGDPRPVFNSRLAHIGSRGRPAGQKVRSVGGSGVWGEEWLIDVEEGPIRQVLISNHPESAKGEPPTKYLRKIEYLVPDARIGPHISKRGVYRVTAISEEGFDVLPIASLDFDCFANPERGCWVLTEGFWEEISTEILHWTGLLENRPPDLVDAVARHAPSRFQWESYQEIANRVLAAPVLFAFLLGREPAEEMCAALSDLGVMARVTEEGPLREMPGIRWVQPGVNPYCDIELKSRTEAPRWIQITESPIRWIELGNGTLEDKADWSDTAFLTGESIG
ncbi:MAG: hypothetical protein IH856_22830, partial [Deltaproteobacteria bacterium]|nr:hypothetical protein [Deltaproteobacteria bacterium]